LLIKKDLKAQQIKQYMAAKIVDITKYSPRSSDIFFFDNNVWMYLFCPLANYNKNKQKHYSAFLQNITISRSTIFISSLVLSEFTNRYLRMDFEQWKDEQKMYDTDFKRNYVGTERYNTTVLEIKRNINQIMKFCEKSSDNFNAIDLNIVLQHLSQIDFNDSYYLELAKISRWKIVTDDSDYLSYKGHDIEIITLLN
jgi:predicted nucleic acid-binding protein